MTNAKRRGSIQSTKKCSSPIPERSFEGAVIESESDLTDFGIKNNMNELKDNVSFSLSPKKDNPNYENIHQSNLYANISPQEFYSRMVELDEINTSR